MKIITTLGIFLLLLGALHSQTISSYVISSAGDNLVGEDKSLYVSIGEALDTELDEGDLMISQGFLQVSLNGNVVSTQELLKEKILIYPNPASQFLIVKTEDHFSHYLYRLNDNNGQQIKTGKLNSDGKIQLDNLHDGIYFISIHKDDLISEMIKVFKIN